MIPTLRDWTWRASGGRPTSDQRDRAHAAVRSALAGLSSGIRSVHDDLQPLQPLEPAGSLVRDIRGFNWRDRRRRIGCHRQFPHQSAPVGRRRKREDFGQAIGRSRGGRTTKIHAVTDDQGRPPPCCSRQATLTISRWHQLPTVCESFSPNRAPRQSFRLRPAAATRSPTAKGSIANAT